MKYWQIFWMFSLLVAGASFAIITFVVTIKGFKDLRDMLTRLGKQQEKKH
jgi:hypothetical protein